MDSQTLRQEVIIDTLELNGVPTNNVLYIPESELYELARKYLLSAGLDIEDLIFDRAMDELKYPYTKEIIMKTLNQAGYEMTGEPVGSLMQVNEEFWNCPLNGEGETPYSLASDYPTRDLSKVVFLTDDMVD